MVFQRSFGLETESALVAHVREGAHVGDSIVQLPFGHISKEFRRIAQVAGELAFDLVVADDVLLQFALGKGFAADVTGGEDAGVFAAAFHVTSLVL